MTPHIQRILDLPLRPTTTRLIHPACRHRQRLGHLMPEEDRFIDDLALTTDLDGLHVAEKVGYFDFVDASTEEVCADARGGVDEVAVVRVKEVFHGCLGGDVDVLLEEFEVVIGIPIDDRDANIRIRVVLPLNSAQSAGGTE